MCDICVCVCVREIQRPKTSPAWRRRWLPTHRRQIRPEKRNLRGFRPRPWQTHLDSSCRGQPPPS